MSARSQSTRYTLATVDLSSSVSISRTLDVSGYVGMSVQGVVDSTGWGSTTAVLSLRHTLDGSNWLVPPYVLDLTETVVQRIDYDVIGLHTVRFDVSTAQTDAGLVTLTVMLY
jgi:hypothetical protein